MTLFLLFHYCLHCQHYRNGPCLIHLVFFPTLFCTQRLAQMIKTRWAVWSVVDGNSVFFIVDSISMLVPLDEILLLRSPWSLSISR